MTQTRPLNIRMMVFSSLFTALIIVGGYISFPIPISPVPIVLADFFMMLAGLFLGASWGLASVGMFVFVGAIGLPVFAGGKGGPAVFLGPTGGFLLGYLIGVYLIGLISERGKPGWLKDLVALVLGNIVLFGLGVTGLKVILKVSWIKAAVLGLTPFMIGAGIKIVAAAVLIQLLRPLIQGNSSGAISGENLP